MSDKNIFLAIIFSFFFLVIILNIYNNNVKGKELINLHKTTEGRLIFSGRGGNYYINDSSRGGSRVKYQYSVNNISYEEVVHVDKFCKNWRGFKTLSKMAKYRYPVLYNPTNPSISRILLKKRDYIYYNQEVPDSLECHIFRFFDCNAYEGINLKIMQEKCKS